MEVVSYFIYLTYVSTIKIYRKTLCICIHKIFLSCQFHPWIKIINKNMLEEEPKPEEGGKGTQGKKVNILQIFKDKG